MKIYGGVEYLQAFLTLALDGGEWSASYPGQFSSGKKALCTHGIFCWVGPSVCLDIVEKKRICASAGDQTLVIQSLAYSLY